MNGEIKIEGCVGGRGCLERGPLPYCNPVSSDLTKES